jgi:hypothetical protein
LSGLSISALGQRRIVIIWLGIKSMENTVQSYC